MAQPQIEGQQFLTADFWLDIIPTENKPIQYLEIGVHSGVNILSVARLHASHPQSRMWCIDPWIDYAEYHHYKGEQETIYNHFCRNIQNFNLTDKIVPIRGFSNKEIPELEDNYFDMIYIDGNISELEFDVIQKLRLSLPDYETGIYESGRLRIEIK